MASLHKDPRGKSPFWYCAYTLPDGRRAFRSTKERDRKRASEVARGWEKAVQAARHGTLVEAQARKILDEILAGVGEPAIRITATREFFSNWLEGKRLAKKAATGERYSTTVTRFLEVLGEKADKPLTALSPADVTRFRDERTRDGVAPSTVRMDLKIVRGILSSGRRQGLILHNPAEAVELPLARAQGRDVFSPEEVKLLLDAAEGDWKTAVLLGYYTGQRLGDVARLTWDRVDLERGTIEFRQAKTGTMVEVPIHPDLEAHLLGIAGDSPKGFLCPTLAPLKVSGRHGLSLRFAEIMAKAGVDQRRVRSSDNRSFSQLSFHSLRHSFASALANAGVPPDVRMKLTGHRTADAHRRYTHLELEPLRQAIQTLPTLKNDRP